MTVHRPVRLTLASLCMATVILRPVPSPGQATNQPPGQQQGASTCGLQRAGDAAGAGYSQGDADRPWRPGADSRCVQPLPDEPVRVSDDDDGPSTVGIIGAIIGAVLVGVLVSKALSGNSRSVNDLAEDGPKAPEKELLGQYEVQGLIYPNWPLVVEVAADADATTFVQLVPARGEKDAIPPLVISDAGGSPWGNRAIIRPVELERTERGVLAKFELPADLGHRGNDGFLSARLSVLSGRLEEGTFRYRPVDVLALGAGPSAIGSAALTITRFDPVPERRRADFTVSWNARQRFENVDAELVRRTATAREVTRRVLSTQDICLTPEQRDLCTSGPATPLPYPRRGAWPVEPARELEPGQSYHMQLRAWTGRSSTGGWIVGQAPRTIGW